MSARDNPVKRPRESVGEGRSRVAVLTGDVIGSTRDSGSDPQALSQSLQSAAEAVRGALPHSGVSGLDIFRGDSWQLLVEKAEDALLVALLFRSHLLGAESRGELSRDTRVGIGVGDVQWIDRQQVSRSQGAAFFASGKALDGLAKSRRRMALCLPAGTEPGSCEIVIELLDVLICRWTARQAWAVNGALRGLIQEDIGRRFLPPLRQRTVADHLHRADREAVDAVLQWWREAIK